MKNTLKQSIPTPSNPRVLGSNKASMVGIKLQCNVCHEKPVVEIVEEPIHREHLICCPNCDKLLACPTEKMYSRKLTWLLVDNTFNSSFGGIPVLVV